jgi:serine/threonine protein kinase
MNKAYSNKALPMGTVLREWRIEEVLGVGGFGIVYKAQGIYFNELVAIKEYFPSSISERDSSDTVVPIDSDSEEVHALGLKKFVEEAKLLWNLSTPSRHPNIVSVRSLFEIHGTAYMVMDFEDGISLSRMLKQGRRFNERSLWNILRPIAEGLDRAHRVGVLHRDIKPPNILINEDNRPVLIDFGSARFTTAEATSTTVTFHTPPYAAIEQYVKTYDQGPWTDIYALGVVMYECITGEKPPEVLERLHAGLGTPLASGKWPGYTKKFLTAVDAAMVVKPEDRPQSLSDWLAMFGKMADDNSDTIDGDDEATRFIAKQVETEEIVPVPPVPNLDPKAPVDTGVPDDPKQAKFKRAGQETGAGKKVPPAPASEEDESVPSRRRVVDIAGKSEAKGADKAVPAAKEKGKRPSPAVIAGAAVALLAIGGVGALALRGGGSSGANAAGSEFNMAAPSTTSTILDQPAGTDANLVENGGENIVNATTPVATAVPDKSIEALQKEQAKAKAAEARLAALQKAQKAAQVKTPEITATPTKGGKAVTPATQTASSSSGGVSSSKQAQFYSVVDDARSMAKRVMRSGNAQNAALARNYDGNLKTLRDSFRGIQSDKDADRLIKQATLTRSYVEFLTRQAK